MSDYGTPRYDEKQIEVSDDGGVTFCTVRGLVAACIDERRLIVWVKSDPLDFGQDKLNDASTISPDYAPRLRFRYKPFGHTSGALRLDIETRCVPAVRLVEGKEPRTRHTLDVVEFHRMPNP